MNPTQPPGSFRYHRPSLVAGGERALATAVVGRALDDLRNTTYAPGAARFLVLDLWESESLWGSLVGTAFARRWVLREVVARTAGLRHRLPERARRRLRQEGVLV